MKKFRIAAIVGLFVLIALRFNNLIFGFSTLAKLISMPPHQIPELYSRDMAYFVGSLIAADVLLMVIFPRKEKPKSKQEQEIGKINRAAYNKNQWPFL